MLDLLLTVFGRAQERLGVETSTPLDGGLPAVLVGVGEDVQRPADLLELPHLGFAYIRAADGNSALAECSDSQGVHYPLDEEHLVPQRPGDKEWPIASGKRLDLGVEILSPPFELTADESLHPTAMPERDNRGRADFVGTQQETLPQFLCEASPFPPLDHVGMLLERAIASQGFLEVHILLLSALLDLLPSLRGHLW